MSISRRQILAQACGLGMALGGSAFGGRLNAQANDAAARPACYDPATLPYMQKSRRRALGYVDASTNPARRCGLCAFFTGTSAACGNCQMLSGGPVAAGGLCQSFAPKAAK